MSFFYFTNKKTGGNFLPPATDQFFISGFLPAFHRLDLLFQLRGADWFFIDWVYLVLASYF
jgi:hypothetical protein